MKKFIAMLEEAVGQKKVTLTAKDPKVDKAADDWALDYNEDHPHVSVHHARNAFIHAHNVGADANQRHAWAQNPAHLDKAMEDEKWRKKDAAAAKASERFNRQADKAPPKPRGLISDTEFRKHVKDTREGFLSDNPDRSIQDVGHDLADSMLHNPKIHDYMKHKYQTTDRNRMKEILGDHLAG